MSYLNPIALAIGAGLLALPLAVHFLTRPRPVRFSFSAVRFLESALRQRRFLARLRDMALLGLRMLLLAAIAFAFARPLLEGADAGKVENVQRRLVILDCSRSMDARRGGVRVFERAQAVALQHLRAEPGVRANIILGAARPRAAFETFSSNWPALQAEARNASVREEELDVPGALARAADLLSAETAQAGASEVIIVTDLQAANWRRPDGGGLPASAAVRFEYVGLDGKAGNLAVTQVAPAQRARRGEAVSMTVDLANYWDSPQSREVVLTANGHAYRSTVDCEAWGEARATFHVPEDAASAAGGWVSGTARIVEARDALPADDVRHFAFRLQEPPVHVLVSREDATHVGSSAYFVWRMLDPGRPGPTERTHVLTSDGIEGGGLAHADLVVLNRPGRLTAGAVQDLSGLLLRGTPVLYILSEQADALNLDAIERACGGQMRLPVRIGAPGARPEGFELASVESSAEPLRSLGDELSRMIRSMKVVSLLTTRAAEEGGGEVLASWDDGSAALFRARAGNGTLVAWNGNIEGSSLPRSAFFVALMREIALQLTLGESGGREQFPVGEARLIELPGEIERAAGLALVDERGEDLPGFQVAEHAAGVAWQWNPVSPPGVYRVTAKGQTVLTVASGCPARESDLRRADAEELLAAMRTSPDPSGARRTVTVRGLSGAGERSEGVEKWPWLIVAGIVVLMAELAVLKAFRV